VQSYGADYLPASVSHEVAKRLPETYGRGDPWGSFRTPAMSNLRALSVSEGKSCLA